MDFTVPTELMSSVTGIAERLYRNRAHIASKTSEKSGMGRAAGESRIFGGVHDRRNRNHSPLLPLPLKGLDASRRAASVTVRTRLPTTIHTSRFAYRHAASFYS